MRLDPNVFGTGNGQPVDENSAVGPYTQRAILQAREDYQKFIDEGPFGKDGVFSQPLPPMEDDKEVTPQLRRYKRFRPCTLPLNTRSEDEDEEMDEHP